MTRPDPDREPDSPGVDASSAADVLMLTDRRGALRGVSEVTLHDDRIELVETGRLAGRIRLDAVTQIRMTVEIAGSDSQVVCRVSSKGSEIAFGSRVWKGPGRWENNALEFRALVLALHKAVLHRRAKIRFIEGQSLSFRLVLCGAGLAMLAGGGVFAWWMMVAEDNLMLAAIALPFMLVGGYLAFLFHPAVPLPYDPEGLVARFERGQAERDAATVD